jgi:hypothetical protein
MKETAFAFLLGTVISVFAFAQEPVRNFTPNGSSSEYVLKLKNEFGKNKEYPQLYEQQILIALSYYPELRDTPIHFRIKERHTPLNTRSSWSGLLKTEQRRDYVITISDATEQMLTPILFQHLPFNAQIGVIGHELGHVIEFSLMATLKIMGHAASNVSSKYVDHFEFKTDSICIAHGLGYQLLAWSSYVRQAMHKYNWDGADNVRRPMTRERYMNPETIEKRIQQLPIYQHVSSDNAGKSFNSITHNVGRKQF